MKKILLSVVCLMMIGIQSVMAQVNVTAPTPPVTVSDLNDSTGYLFYNWEADRYVYSYSYKQNNIGSARAYNLVKQSDGMFRIYYISGNSKYYWYTSGNSSESGTSSISTTNSPNSYDTNFTFTDIFLNDSTTGAKMPTFVIQRPATYDNYFATKSIQFPSEQNDLYEMPGISHWLIAPATDAGRRYLAQARLYRMLSTLGQYTTNNTGALSYYENIYNNPESTAADLDNAVIALQNADDINSWCNSKWTNTEYPLFFADNSNASYRWEKYEYNNNIYLYRYVYNSSDYPTSMTFTATVTVDQEAILRYCIYDDYNYSPSSSTQEVFIDDVLVRKLSLKEFQRKDRYYHEMLSPGAHTVKFVFSNTSSAGCQPIIKYISVFKLPAEISVNLVEQGSLGTEVLKYVPNVSDVRHLKVSGKFGSKDFEYLEMMPKLMQLDLSETDLTEIPIDQFNRYTKSNVQYLHKLVLPKGLEKIGVRTFYQSYIEDFTFPETMKSIGDYAFYESRIKEAMLPDSMESVGVRAFSYCYGLKHANWPAKIKSVPRLCFHNSRYMETCMLHEGLTEVQHSAFRYCNSLHLILPATLTTVRTYGLADAKIDTLVMTRPMTIQNNAFHNSRIDSLSVYPGTTIGDYGFYQNNIRHLVLPDNTPVGYNAFGYCQLQTLKIGEGCSLGAYAFTKNKLKEVWLPTTYYTATSYDSRYYDYGYYDNSDNYYYRGMYANASWDNGYDFEDSYDYSDYSGNYIFSNNPTLERMIIKSPTVMTGNGRSNLFADCNNTFKFVVPQFLVSSYKLADFWNAYSARIEGFSTADVDYWEIYQPLTLYYDSRFEGSPTINIQGGGYLTIKGDAPMNINDFKTWHNLNWPSEGTTAQIISDSENIIINGKYTYSIYTTANKWYFTCMPFNFRPSEITNDNGADYVLYYYDGANRAVNGASGSWKRIPNDTIVTAGTGFIIQTSKNEHTNFLAVDDADKARVLSNNIFVRTLEQHHAEESANLGWNLVGNPYLCYYNLHKLGFTAPITTWTGSTYKAYSIIDDDYAIKPNEAFFVQCPDEVTTITFPIAGRQMTSEITDQNGAPAMRAPELADRKLLELQMTYDNMQDETRVVFNNRTSARYETQCDASKFMSLDSKVPQLYTLDDAATRYAINERPAGDGSVQVGFTAPKSGTYTLSARRNRNFGQVCVLDHKTGLTYDMTETGYSFYAEAGTDNTRLVLMATDATGIKNVDTDWQTSKRVETYDIGGRRVTKQGNGLYIMRSADGKTRKVVVK